MAKTAGFGGFFFRARDHEALARWYEDVLGVTEFWTQDSGLTVFAPFTRDSDHFSADKQWMINFRVDDLDQVLRDLRAAGIAVETRPDEWDNPETGRFARIQDPEDNPIELWEPPEEIRRSQAVSPA